MCQWSEYASQRTTALVNWIIACYGPETISLFGPWLRYAPQGYRAWSITRLADGDNPLPFVLQIHSKAEDARLFPQAEFSMDGSKHSHEISRCGWAPDEAGLHH